MAIESRGLSAALTAAPLAAFAHARGKTAEVPWQPADMHGQQRNSARSIEQ